MKIELKQVLLYAITPALIAGLFSIAPKLYEVATEPRAVLQYTLVLGPAITVDGSLQQVVSARVSNSGKRTLTSLRGELSIPGGTVVASSIENGSGLPIDSKQSSDKVVVSVPKILEGEAFFISALLKSNKTGNQPTFLLRSEETLGKQEQPTTSAFKDIRPTLLSALLAALSVLTMALFALIRLKSAILPTKRNAILYIARATKLDSFVQAVLREGDDITYMDFADMLLALGREGDEESKSSAIAGLTCLLALESMANHSRNIAKRNLEVLSGQAVLRASKAEKLLITDALTFRNYVDGVFTIKGSGESAA
jgi:hypothetical protein